MPKKTAALSALAAAFASATASASPSAHLVYSRAHGAESCPDEQALRSAVATRVGYDPFFPWAKQTVIVAVTPGPSGGFIASVSLVDERGVDHGMRTFRTQGACAEVVDVAALAIAIAIDPRSLMPRPASASAPPPAIPVPPPAVTSAPAPPPAIDREPEPEALPSPPSKPRTAFEVSVGVVASEGVGIRPSLGAALGAGLRRWNLSTEIEGLADRSASARVGDGDLSSSRLMAQLIACVHAGPAFLCALGQVGHLEDSRTGDVQASQSTTWAAVGGRFGVDVPLVRTLALRVRSDVVGDLSRRTLQLGAYQDYWTAPPVATSLGIDLALHFE